MVNSVNNIGAQFGLNQQAPAHSSSLGQEDFLRLMVAQSQHQDPLQPEANGEFLSQLAQFSTNDGITKMQKSLEQLAGSLQSNQALQASALVGRKVLVEGNALNLGAEGGVNASIESSSTISNLTASIYSSSGELVKTIPIGQVPDGPYQIQWDGNGENNQRLAAGKYKIEVTGTYEGKPVALKTMTTANVDSVSLGQNGDGVKLNVSGVGAVNLSDIKQISV